MDTIDKAKLKVWKMVYMLVGRDLTGFKFSKSYGGIFWNEFCESYLWLDMRNFGYVSPWTDDKFFTDKFIKEVVNAEN